MRNIVQFLKEAYFSFVCLFIIQKTVIKDEKTKEFVLSWSGINQTQSESSQSLFTAIFYTIESHVERIMTCILIETNIAIVVWSVLPEYISIYIFSFLFVCRLFVYHS